ncbi:6-phosphogluconolactonase [Thiovibrio frasassiensis]|uniref:6-phosphogluconolactonase n=1 Tax=Thiovibrio frasassiensis TaxID=2984131 RepID=A0A9X4MHV7_9BACT|nr:6-phosphogluconolactonase [Thiovibrio frasassiensis]MDG4475144.1 6-phosphogluconolactonase [Thiovibrio frasassiensis]
MPEFKEFKDSSALVAALADRVAELLRVGIRARDRASLVVSGGSTPLPFFAALSEKHLDWEEVVVTLADERWVEPSDAASNEQLVRRYLLQNRAALARFVGLKTEALTAAEGENDCAERLAGVPRPFDALVLGMGNDGHTASLFPQAARLKKALALDSGQLCMAITPPAAPHERMTLTLPTLLQSREIILHIVGSDKRIVYEKALAEGPVGEMPIRAILRQTFSPVTVFWSP